MKPETPVGKQQASAPAGPSGVVGDSARGQIGREAWETRREAAGAANVPREEHNRGVALSGVGEARMVAEKRGNARGAKGPC
jgi:hypothetical protein